MQTQLNFTELLDLVALVQFPMWYRLIKNNRILAYQGLARIRAERCRPGIRALAEIANRNSESIDRFRFRSFLLSKITFGAFGQYVCWCELLLADDMQHARQLAFELDSLNQAREEIE